MISASNRRTHVHAAAIDRDKDVTHQISQLVIHAATKASRSLVSKIVERKKPYQSSLMIDYRKSADSALPH